MSEAAKLKARLLADVRAHMLVYGPKRWDLVRKNYPEVNATKFFRWTRELREGGTYRGGDRQKTKAADVDIVAAAETARAESLEDAADRARLQTVKNIPAAPSPEYMSRAGLRAEEQLDFLRMITRLAADGEILRAYSVTVDPLGAEKLKNPAMFATSISARLKVLDTAVRIMQEVWDLQYMQRFFDEIVEIIVEEIGPADPALQARVLTRLKALNDRRGITQYAGMG